MPNCALICHGQVWNALPVAVTPQRAGAGLAITQIPRNLPGPRLGAAVQSSCCEDCILELLPALRVGEVMGRIQRPIHRKASPTTVEKCLSQQKIGTTEKIHHKRRLVFRSFGYILKKRRSQLLSWTPSRLRLGLTLGCRASRRATNPLSAQDH